VLLAERHGGTLCTKPISEGMGPVEDSCPARILDLLTETADEHAIDWRRRCRRRLARGRPRKGEPIVFATAVKFTDGTQHEQLTYLKGSRFRADGREYHIPSWWLLDYRVDSRSGAHADPSAVVR